MQRRPTLDKIVKVGIAAAGGIMTGVLAACLAFSTSHIVEYKLEFMNFILTNYGIWLALLSLLIVNALLVTVGSVLVGSYFVR